MLKINYTTQEKKELEELHKKLKVLQLNTTPFITPLSVPQNVIDTFKAVGDTFSAIGAIKAKGEARAITYYSLHLDELAMDILDEVKAALITTANGNPEYVFSADWCEQQRKSLLIFFLVLQKNAPDLYKQTMKNVKNVFKNRKELINSEYAKSILKTTPKEELPMITEYSKMLQSKGVNALSHIGKRDFSVDPISGNGIAQTDNGVRIEIKNLAVRGLDKLATPARQMLDIMLIKLTSALPHNGNLTDEQAAKYRSTTLTVKEFAAMRDIDERNAYEQLKKYFSFAYDTEVTCDEERWEIKKGKRKLVEKYHVQARIVDSLAHNLLPENPIKNGKLIFGFSLEWVRYLDKACTMLYPNNLLKINSKRNPHSYYIGRKLVEYYNINRLYGKKNLNRISVRALLDELPDMPDYEEEISKRGRHVRERMIDPFERDMDALIEYGILKSWEYCNSGEAPLTDEQLENYKKERGAYEEWIKWLVKFELSNYPEQPQALEALPQVK